MDKKLLIKNLEANKEWLNDLTDRRKLSRDIAWQAEAIMIGCLSIINHNNRHHLSSFLSRNIGGITRFKVLQNIVNIFWSGSKRQLEIGKRVLSDLIDLTISEIEIRVGEKEIVSEALPILVSSRIMTEEHKEAIIEGRRKKREAREKAKKARIEAILTKNR